MRRSTSPRTSSGRIASSDQRNPVLISGSNIHLSYGPTRALRGASLDVREGEVLALMGRSGCGKSSLLYCLAGIASPDQGRVVFASHDVWSMDDSARSSLRRKEFGFVFQFGELVPELTIRENVSLPLRLNKRPGAEIRSSTAEILERLGIAEVGAKRPAEVSGGQSQRAAVARAVIHRPRVIFADEPTGSLDVENGRLVLEEFVSIARGAGSAVVLVTHEQEVANRADRVLTMIDGLVAGDGD